MFLIVDDFGTFPLLVTDEEGVTLEFETKEEAEEYAEDNCQPEYYYIVEI